MLADLPHFFYLWATQFFLNFNKNHAYSGINYNSWPITLFLHAFHVYFCRIKILPRYWLQMIHFSVQYNHTVFLQAHTEYTYCTNCKRAWPSDDPMTCPHHTGTGLTFDGVFIIPNFVNEQEELELVKEINRTPWILSQSGRRKQVVCVTIFLFNMILYHSW